MMPEMEPCGTPSETLRKPVSCHWVQSIIRQSATPLLPVWPVCVSGLSVDRHQRQLSQEVEVQMFVPSAPHMFSTNCFSLLCSAVCFLHFWFIGSEFLCFIKYVFWHFGDFFTLFITFVHICGYFFSDSFFTENILHVCFFCVFLRFYFQLFMFQLICWLIYKLNIE